MGQGCLVQTGGLEAHVQIASLVVGRKSSCVKSASCKELNIRRKEEPAHYFLAALCILVLHLLKHVTKNQIHFQKAMISLQG